MTDALSTPSDQTKSNAGTGGTDSLSFGGVVQPGDAFPPTNGPSNERALAVLGAVFIGENERKDAPKAPSEVKDEAHKAAQTILKDAAAGKWSAEGKAAFTKVFESLSPQTKADPNEIISALREAGTEINKALGKDSKNEILVGAFKENDGSMRFHIALQTPTATAEDLIKAVNANEDTDNVIKIGVFKPSM